MERQLDGLRALQAPAFLGGGMLRVLLTDFSADNMFLDDGPVSREAGRV